MSSRALLALFVALIVPVACGGASSSAPPKVAAPSSASTSEPNDTCLTIPTGCPGTTDEDGCPDVGLELGPDCNVGTKDAKTLSVMAQEMLKEKRLTKLRIVTSTKDCAGAVATKLVAGGVPVGRIETKIIPGNHYIYFEVAAWNGTACGG